MPSVNGFLRRLWGETAAGNERPMIDLAELDTVHGLQLHHRVVSGVLVVVATVPTQLGQQQVGKRQSVEAADGLANQFQVNPIS